MKQYTLNRENTYYSYVGQGIKDGNLQKNAAD